MLLHAALGPRGERLGNLAPRAPRVPQRLEPLLLGRRPRRVGAPLLRDRARQLRRRVVVRGGLRDEGRGGVAEGAGGGVEVGDAAFAGVGGGLLGAAVEGLGVLVLLLLLLLGRELLCLELGGAVLGMLREGEAGGVVRGLGIAVVVSVGVAEGGGGEVGGEGELGGRGRVGALLGGDGGFQISRTGLGGISAGARRLDVVSKAM